MSTLTLVEAYVAGWRTCRRKDFVGELRFIYDANGMSKEQQEAWAQGLYDAITRPQQQEPDAMEAGYD